MARLDYRQKTKLKIWLLAILLILSVCILSDCNNSSGTIDINNIDAQSSNALTVFIRNSLLS